MKKQTKKTNAKKLAKKSDAKLYVKGISAPAKKIEPASKPLPTRLEEQLKASLKAVGDKPKAPRSAATLKPGDVITKVYKGATHKVTVVEGGRFRYGKEIFPSLSAVAEHMMAPHRSKNSKGRVSGVSFFGLAAGTSPGRRASSPATLINKAHDLLARASKMTVGTKAANHVERAIANAKTAAAALA